MNAGRLLENLVFTGLRRVHPGIFHYRTKGGREVDFVVPGRPGATRLVQVCESLADAKTRKRETAAMAELGLARGTLVTRDEEGQVATEGGAIEIVPVWRFLLQLPDAPA